MEIKFESEYLKIQKVVSVVRKRFKNGKFRGANHVIISDVGESEAAEIAKAIEADWKGEIQRRGLEVYNGE